MLFSLLMSKEELKGKGIMNFFPSVSSFSRCRAAQLASIRQMIGKVSRGSAGGLGVSFSSAVVASMVLESEMIPQA